jgi:uncharacterized protein
MNYLQLIDAMSPDLYQSLLRAIALGKWPDGRFLTAEQREHAMQAVIAWGERHLAEQDRVGYLEKKATIVEGQCDMQGDTTLTWIERDG